VSAPQFGRQCTAVVALVAAVAAVSWVLAASAGADPLADCTASAGTVVAVDFGHWHGPVVRGCARNAANGLDLLHAAGFVTTGDVHDGPASSAGWGTERSRVGRNIRDRTKTRAC
jgi:hypothetical protein